jgi:hypothetical protein
MYCTPPHECHEWTVYAGTRRCITCHKVTPIEPPLTFRSMPADCYFGPGALGNEWPLRPVAQLHAELMADHYRMRAKHGF